MSPSHRPAATALAVAVLMIGCRFGGREAPRESEASLPAATASRGPFRVVVREVGVLTAASSVALHAPFSGRIAKLVPEGSLVESGDPLLWMDTEPIEQRLARVRQERLAAEGQLGQSLEGLALQAKAAALDEAVLDAESRHEQAKLRQARREAEDAERQAALGLIRRSEAEARELVLAGAELEHERAEAATSGKREDLHSSIRRLEVDRQEARQHHEQASRWLKATEDLMERAVLRAPTAGRVYLPRVQLGGSDEPRKVRVGAQVSAWIGAIIELPEARGLRVETQMDESLLARIRPGTPAEVRLAALEDLVLPAQVRRVGFLAVPRSSSAGAGFRERHANEAVEQVVFPVELQLERHDPRLQAGMSVAVSYLLESFEEAVSIPSAAIFGTSEQPFVFVRTAAGFRIQELRLGPESEAEVVVLEGLEGGEVVLLGDPRSLS